MTHALCCAFVASLFAGGADNPAETVPLYLEFRDGSVLKLPVADDPWQVTAVEAGGRVVRRTVRPSRLREVALTAADNFPQKQALLSTVQKLGSADFRERERAWADLARMGPGVRADLEACLRLAADAETQTRLAALLKRLPEAVAPGPPSGAAFDRFDTGGGTYWGYLNEQAIRVVMAGKAYPLTRRDVRLVAATPPAGVPVTWQQPRATFQRLARPQFPAGCTEEAFEQEAGGRSLQYGERVNELFLSKGFLLSTPLKDSYVCTHNHTIGGREGSRAVGNHKPARQGEVVVEFVRPGQPHLPAAVSHFGCWVTGAVRGGVSLLAYDVQGRELGRVVTEEDQYEFVGFASALPVHRVRVLPGAAGGRTFLLDDFIFMPAANPLPADPAAFLVTLRGGDEVRCADVRLGGGSCALRGLPGGLPDLTVPAGEVTRVNLPGRFHPGGLAPPTGVFAELSDGSVLLGRQPDGKFQQPVFARRPDLFRDTDALAGLWGVQAKRSPGDDGPDTGLLLGDGQWQPVSAVRLLEEVVLWKNPEGRFEATGYNKLPLLRLRRAHARPTGTWVVETSLGERLVLDAEAPLAGTLTERVRGQWQGRPVEFTPAEVVSLSRGETR